MSPGTVQEKYLHARHLPNVRLRPSPKPILTPRKPRSVPLIPMATPSPSPSSPMNSLLYPGGLNPPSSPQLMLAGSHGYAEPINDLRAHPADFFANSPELRYVLF